MERLTHCSYLEDNNRRGSKAIKHCVSIFFGNRNFVHVLAESVHGIENMLGIWQCIQLLFIAVVNLLADREATGMSYYKQEKTLRKNDNFCGTYSSTGSMSSGKVKGRESPLSSSTSRRSKWPLRMLPRMRINAAQKIWEDVNSEVKSRIAFSHSHRSAWRRGSKK